MAEVVSPSCRRLRGCAPATEPLIEAIVPAVQPVTEAVVEPIDL